MNNLNLPVALVNTVGCSDSRCSKGDYLDIGPVPHGSFAFRDSVTLVPHGDAARIREAIARIISNDTIHGAPEAAADRVMRDVLNIGDNDGS